MLTSAMYVNEHIVCCIGCCADGLELFYGIQRIASGATGSGNGELMLTAVYYGNGFPLNGYRQRLARISDIFSGTDVVESHGINKVDAVLYRVGAEIREMVVGQS